LKVNRAATIWESEDGQIHSKRFLKVESWQFTQYRRQDDSTEAAPEKHQRDQESHFYKQKVAEKWPSQPASALGINRLSR
jgi:hypothetical protein